MSTSHLLISTQEKEGVSPWLALCGEVNRLRSLLSDYKISLNSEVPSSAQKDFEFKHLEEQKGIVKYLASYNDLLDSAQASGTRLSDNRKATWSCLSLMNLKCTSDVFDKISEDDVIEFYSADHRQIYRNIQFFNLCSYTIFDILLYEWNTLYQRDESVATTLLTQANELLDGKLGTDILRVEKHLLVELRGEKRKAMINPGIISPLWERNSAPGAKPIAYLATLKAELVEPFSS